MGIKIKKSVYDDYFFYTTPSQTGAKATIFSNQLAIHNASRTEALQSQCTDYQSDGFTCTQSTHNPNRPTLQVQQNPAAGQICQVSKRGDQRCPASGKKVHVSTHNRYGSVRRSETRDCAGQHVLCAGPADSPADELRSRAARTGVSGDIQNNNSNNWINRVQPHRLEELAN